LAVADSKVTIIAQASSSTCTAGKTFVVDGTGWVVFTGSLSSYISALPRDPLNVAPNCYIYGANALGEWELDAALESLDNATVATNDGGNANTCTTMPAAACQYELGTNRTIL